MGERIKHITSRIKRVFGKEAPKEAPKESPKKIRTSRVVRPEESALPRPRKTPSTRKHKISPRVTICVLADGTTHVSFPNGAISSKTVDVRDPITRRLSRRKLEGGIQKTTTYYGRDGRLISDQ